MADRGALSFEAGAAASGTRLPAPYAPEPAPRTYGAAPSFSLAIRYSLRNDLAVGVTGFYDLPVSYFHDAATVPTPAGAFSGTLSHRFERYGAAAALRYERGTTWRVFAELDAGWCRRTWYGFGLVDGTARSYGLVLPSFSVDTPALAFIPGVSFRLGDRVTVGVAPRLELLLGSRPEWMAAVGLLATWDTYP
jgi:hypothetical protein